MEAADLYMLCSVNNCYFSTWCSALFLLATCRCCLLPSVLTGFLVLVAARSYLRRSQPACCLRTISTGFFPRVSAALRAVTAAARAFGSAVLWFIHRFSSFGAARCLLCRCGAAGDTRDASSARALRDVRFVLGCRG